MAEANLNAVRNDIRSLAKDAQELYREAGNATGEKADAMRSKGASMLEAVVNKAKHAQASVLETGKDLAVNTDDYVHVNPWKAMVVTAGIGVLVGVLLGRK